MDIERISRLLAAVLAAAGAIVAALGALSAARTATALGLVGALAGAILYWAFGWFWAWYWDWLERLQRGDVEPTAALRASLVVAVVAVVVAGFVVIWWLADSGGVVPDQAPAGNLISTATVTRGAVPGVVLGGGLFALAWVLRARDAPLDVTKGSRGFQLVAATVVCTYGAYCLLLVLHPPSALAFAVTYPVSLVATAGGYLFGV